MLFTDPDYLGYSHTFESGSPAIYNDMDLYRHGFDRYNGRGASSIVVPDGLVAVLYLGNYATGDNWSIAGP